MKESRVKLASPISTLLLLGLSLPLSAQQLGDPNCETLLLVSSYSNNSIKVYDGCDGSFIQNLQHNGWVSGPQAIADDGEGGLVVVSEKNDRLVRFDRKTLAVDRVVAGDDPGTPELEPGPVDAPTGLVITPDGRWFVGSFTQNQVVELDPQTGTASNVVIRSGQGIEGADTGMWLQGNQLYVPGFDSSTVVRVNIGNGGAPQTLVAAGSNGLNAPRTTLIDDQGDLLVSSWRSNQILAFNPTSGAFKRVVASISRPTGMTLEAGGTLLVASDQSHDVKRVRISDGQMLGQVVETSSGGLVGATWVHVLEKQAVEQTTAAASNAFFLIGVGEVVGNTISVETLFHTNGGLWSSELDAAQISEHAWGQWMVEFSGCNEGEMTYASDFTEFGAGGYTLIRLAPSPISDECVATGFANVDNRNWMSGHWFGGPDHAGEGFSIDLINGDQAIITWYSYLPASLANSAN